MSFDRCVDITGINVTKEAELKLIFDPFSQTRLENESNPFVVDARVAHVPVHDDIEDNQEFNGMLSKVLLEDCRKTVMLLRVMHVVK